MKKVIIIFLGLILIGAGAYLGRDFLPKITSSQGEVFVESQPEATVFIDGENKGETPFSQRTDPGQYEVKILPDDQAAISSWQNLITVNPGTQTYIKTQLGSSSTTSTWEIITLEDMDRNQTELTIASETAPAEIYLDSDFKGTVPLSFDDIEPGDHEIRLTAPGFAEKTVKITVTEGYKLGIQTQLALVDESQIDTEDGDEEEESEISEEPEPEQQMVRIASPTTGWLRVRSEPSTAGEEVARVDDGEEVALLDENEDGWYEVEYEEGESGWISGAYAEKIEESE